MRGWPLAVAVALAAPARAADRFAEPVAGVDVGECLDRALPCRTLAYALGKAISGDRVVALAGTYSDAGGQVFPLRVNRGVVLTAEAGPAATRIERTDPLPGSNRTIVLRLDGPSVAAPTAVERFTVSGGGIAGNQYGIVVESAAPPPDPGEPAPAVRDCRVDGFSRAAIHLLSIGFGGQTVSLVARVERNEVRRSATGISVETVAVDGLTAVEDASTLRNNVVLDCGVGIAVSTLYDEVLLTAPTGNGTIALDVRHNTVRGATGDAVVLAARDATGSAGLLRAGLANNVLAHSGGVAVREDRGDGSPRFLLADASALEANVLFANALGDYFDADTAMTYTGTSGPGGVHTIPDLAGASSLNLEGDPRADPASGRLEAGSVCLDAASAAFPVADDIDGEARPSGPAPDIGADELLPALRRGVFTALAPLTPDRASLFPALPPHVGLGPSPFLDPDRGVLRDSTRPLVAYQLPDGNAGVLRLVKAAAADSVELFY